jgi:hypothetical protein
MVVIKVLDSINKHTPFDLMYHSCDAIEADVEAKLGQGEATVGYSTCLCHSVLQATPVFHGRGWFQTLRDRLKSIPYPDRLVEGIIKMNLPVLGGTIHRPRPNGWRRMCKLPAREPAAWKAAWPTTSRPCARGWSTTYRRRGCSPRRLLNRCRMTRLDCRQQMNGQEIARLARDEVKRVQIPGLTDDVIRRMNHEETALAVNVIFPR